jgi:hypothetical protein
VAACVRNPLDRAISIYHFFRSVKWPPRDSHHLRLQRAAKAMDLSTFWETIDIAAAASRVRHFKSQSEFLRGATITHLLRFENLREDFARLAQALDCPQITLPHLNAAPRDEQELSPAAEQRIREFYGDDFSQWYPHLIRELVPS